MKKVFLRKKGRYFRKTFRQDENPAELARFSVYLLKEDGRATVILEKGNGLNWEFSRLPEHVHNTLLTKGIVSEIGEGRYLVKDADAFLKELFEEGFEELV